MEAPGESKREKSGRKWPGCSFLIVLAGFAFFSVSGWMRLARALSDWSWLEEAGVPARYLAISGAGWGIVALAALVWLFFRLPRFQMVALGAGVVLALSYWGDRLLLGSPYGVELNAPFALALTLLALLYLWFELRPYDEIRGGNQGKPGPRG